MAGASELATPGEATQEGAAGTRLAEFSVGLTRACFHIKPPRARVTSSHRPSHLPATAGCTLVARVHWQVAKRPHVPDRELVAAAAKQGVHPLAGIAKKLPLQPSSQAAGISAALLRRWRSGRCGGAPVELVSYTWGMHGVAAHCLVKVASGINQCSGDM